MSLDELEKSKEGGEKAWENVKPALEEVATLLKENGGPFFMGEQGREPQRVLPYFPLAKSGKTCSRET